jgi:ABC-2 type transport system ATP-binding protein
MPATQADSLPAQTDAAGAQGARVPAVRVEGLHKRYAKAIALEGLSLTVGAGEAFGLAGLNGAGKTTLIKCLLDFCATDAGHIEIFGVAHRDTAARRRLAFLPERFIPPYYLTGRDFLRYMLTLYGAAFDAERAADMLAALDLEPGALLKPVRTFSKGMTQKLGLAACLLSGRDLLVLDEPTSGLDPKARALLKRQLAALVSRGHTLFLTSHSLADIEEICERMAILHRGRLCFAGAPQALKAAHGAATLESAFLACIERAAA